MDHHATLARWSAPAQARNSRREIVLGLGRRYLRVNRALCDLLGRTSEELVGTSTAEVTHPDDRFASATHLGRLLAGEISSFQIEKRYLHRDGHAIPVLLSVSPIRDAASKPLYYLSQLLDLSPRKALEERLAHLASHDPLTGLPNRSLFAERLAHALDRARARRTILYVDLDDFRAINDVHGHDAGDRVLVAVAERLRPVTRGGDTVARLGGDEFAVLLEDLDGEEEAVDVAKRLSERLRPPVLLGRQAVAVRASVGVALASGEVLPDELLRRGDGAMYAAKRAGKGRHAVSTLGAAAA